MKLTNQIRALLYMPPRLPEVANIEITNRCNLSCLMCRRHELEEEEPRRIDLSIFKKMVWQLAGIDWLCLSGIGEPFTHPQLFEMIILAKSLGHKVAMATNGFWKNNTYEYTEHLNNVKLDALRISVDDVLGSNPLGHPLNTKDIEYIIRHVKAKVVINTVFSIGNIEQLQRIIDWANDLGAPVDIHKLLTYQGSHAASVPPELSRRVLANLHGRFNTVDKQRRGFRALLHRRWTRCPSVYNNIYIRMNGDVTLCNSISLADFRVFGNMLRRPWREIWDGFRDVRTANVDDIPECKSCLRFWDKRQHP